MNPAPAEAAELDAFLTVDVEHAGSSYARSRPETRLPATTLDCESDGRPLGLPFIIGTLRDHGLSATFFVEPLHVHYYGDGPLGRAVDMLLRNSMDVQLHAHPAWLAFRDGRQRSDRMHAFPAGEQEEILGEARGRLERLGAKVVAFRGGGFAANDDTYLALRNLGIPYSSSYNLARLGGDCLIRGAGRRNDPFAIAGCTEVPLTSYRIRDIRRGLGYALKHFQIGNTPAARGKEALERALALGMRSVNILLHNFEFVRRDGKEWFLGPFREHAALTRSFRELCVFLAENRSRFRPATFGGLPPGWAAEGTRPGKEACPLPTVRGIYLPV